MLRFLADYSYVYGPLRVLDSITFRVMLGMFFAFIMCAVLGKWFIRMMAAMKATEDVSKPDSQTLDKLHAGKKGTPTMGGAVIVFSVALCGLLFCDPTASALLHVNDISDGGMLAQTIVASEKLGQSTPAARLWTCLSDDGRKAAQVIAEKGYDVSDISSAEF
ncbi:MAG: hypothetical protein JXR97_10275, partial [Planctomycetes bacterium]|nr:hypothetical protein [Planctomycetota bacterium]